jgi:hypothetical protein
MPQRLPTTNTVGYMQYHELNWRPRVNVKPEDWIPDMTWLTPNVPRGEHNVERHKSETISPLSHETGFKHKTLIHGDYGYFNKLFHKGFCASRWQLSLNSICLDSVEFLSWSVCQHPWVYDRQTLINSLHTWNGNSENKTNKIHTFNLNTFTYQESVHRKTLFFLKSP